MRKGRARYTLLALACALVQLALLAGPAGAASNWTLRQLPPSPGHGPWGPPLSGVSCPTESLCVAVGGLNTVAFSQAPTGGSARWHVVSPSYPIGPGVTCVEGEAHCHVPSGAINAVSCASEALCAAVTYDGFILVSTDPTGGAAAWTATSINEPHGTGAAHLIGISCPSPSLCVAVSGGSNNSNGGRVLTSTNPAAGQWQVANLGSSLDLRGVSCGTPALCVAVARGGRIFASTNPTGGASAWREAGAPGGPGDLEGVSCVSTMLCAAGNLTGNVLTSTDPAGGAVAWSEANAGGLVQITGVSCPTASRCVAVDNNGDVLTSADPTGGAGSWHFENLVAFSPTAEREGQPPRNALFAASCASTTLCALVGIDGRIFTATDPFSAPADPPARKARRRPRTILVFAEHFWKDSRTRHRRFRARFRFYSPTSTKGFECKRDRRRYRRCRSPLRYWVGHGRHVLRVRAIGPTGLRGPAAVKRFRVRSPRRPPASTSAAATPSAFVGVSPQAPLHRHDLRLMRRVGVGSLRFLIYWSQSEPEPGVLDWRATDEFMKSTSRYGFERLPVVWGSPSWLARPPRANCDFTADRCSALQMPVHGPAQRRAWSTFLRALVERYGPSGSFWELHPELTRDPIRTWQIWNEENDHRFGEASVRGYAALLRNSAPAIRSVDPNAQIVLGGLFATPKVKPSLDATVFLDRLYRQRGVRGLFDGVGLHPYAADPSLMAADISAVRAVMRSHGEGRKGIYITEFGWGSQTRAAGGDKFEQGPAAQAEYVQRAWDILFANRRRWNLRAAFWFTWQDIPAASTPCDFCDSAGLLRLNGRPKAALRRFAQAVRR